MSSKIALNHDHLILDACCIINLYASGRMSEIIHSITEQVVVTTYVQTEEALTVYKVSKQAAPIEREVINLRPLLESQLLIAVDLENDAEKLIFAQLAAERLDDGEATTVAIAAHRQWAIATDDHRARRLCGEYFGGIQLISTPELLDHWSTVMNPTTHELGKTLIAIEQRANFLVSRGHPLYEWWETGKKKV